MRKKGWLQLCPMLETCDQVETAPVTRKSRRNFLLSCIGVATATEICRRIFSRNEFLGLQDSCFDTPFEFEGSQYLVERQGASIVVHVDERRFQIGPSIRLNEKKVLRPGRDIGNMQYSKNLEGNEGTFDVHPEQWLDKLVITKVAVPETEVAGVLRKLKKAERNLLLEVKCKVEFIGLKQFDTTLHIPFTMQKEPIHRLTASR